MEVVVASAAASLLAKEVAKAGVSVLLVYSTHYGSTKLYDAVCVPDGISGFIQGLITTASPWCKLTLEVMRATENQYTTAVMLGISKIVMGAIGI